jgi:hypothetical protein
VARVSKYIKTIRTILSILVFLAGCAKMTKMTKTLRGFLMKGLIQYPPRLYVWSDVVLPLARPAWNVRKILGNLGVDCSVFFFFLQKKGEMLPTGLLLVDRLSFTSALSRFSRWLATSISVS